MEIQNDSGDANIANGVNSKSTDSDSGTDLNTFSNQSPS